MSALQELSKRYIDYDDYSAGTRKTLSYIMRTRNVLALANRWRQNPLCISAALLLNEQLLISP